MPQYSSLHENIKHEDELRNNQIACFYSKYMYIIIIFLPRTITAADVIPPSQRDSLAVRPYKTE